MNPKELFFSALKNEQPVKWMGYGFDAFPKPYPAVFDPVSVLDAMHYGKGIYVDLWGVTWRKGPDDPGAIPIVTEENKVIKDLLNWRDYVKFPDVSGLDWSGAKEQVAAIDRETTLVMIPSFYGPFERAHVLAPFDELLISMHTDPDVFYDLIGALTDWKIEALRHVIDNLQPDIIHSHDDWGDRTRLFFSPELFRKLLKPHYTRLYEYIKSRGVLVQHHCDGYATGLEMDMLDMGIDMWQGVIPQNDIKAIQKNTGGKLLLMGGIDQTLFDKLPVDEDLIRGEVRRAIDEYAPGGAYLPAIASLVCFNPEVMTVVVDEADKYGKIWLSKQ